MILLNKIEVTIQNGDLVVTNVAGTGPHTVQLTITHSTNNNTVHSSAFTVPPTQTIPLSGISAGVYLTEFIINNETALVKLVISTDPNQEPVLKPHETGIIIVAAGRIEMENTVVVEPTLRVYGEAIAKKLDLKVRVKIMTEDGTITKFDEEYPVAAVSNPESFSISTAEYPAGTYTLSYEFENEEYIIQADGIQTFTVD